MGIPRVGSSPTTGTTLRIKGFRGGTLGVVDTPRGGMHDKSMTKVRSITRKGRAFHRVKHGSAVVPIYCGTVQSRTRYPMALWLNGLFFSRQAKCVCSKHKNLFYSNGVRELCPDSFVVGRLVLAVGFARVSR